MVHIQINESGVGKFWIKNRVAIVVTMHICLTDGELTIRRTRGLQKGQGRNLATRVLKEVVAYARLHHLKIVAASDFVQQQFHERPNSYSDVWEKGWH